MPKFFYKFFPTVSLMIISSLAVTGTGCSQGFGASEEVEEPAETHALEALSHSVSAEQSTSASAPTHANLYQQAIDRASSAFILSRSAQSQDDWRLVASRWQQAIDLMKLVPDHHSQHTQAQKKVAEYRNNLVYAQQQANRPTSDLSASGTVIIHSPGGSQATGSQTSNRNSPNVPNPAPSIATTARSSSVAVAQPPASESQSTFYAPIVRREGNTPVIRVTFNGEQAFDMIVDTGASGTLITRQQAQTLGVAPVATAMVDTASQQGVRVPLGFVNSIEVNGAIATNVLVAIAGSQLGTGLLGHDFFGNYDVTIRETEVEFRERPQREG